MGFLKRKKEQEQPPRQQQHPEPQPPVQPPPEPQDEPEADEVPVKPDQVVPDGWPSFDIDPNGLERVEEISNVLSQMPGVTGVLTEPHVQDQLGLPATVRLVVEREGQPPVPVILDVISPRAHLMDRRVMAFNIRSDQMFRYSPIAVYSAYPIPEDVKYILAGSYEALFESQLALPHMQSVPFDQQAAIVPGLVKEFFSLDLDLSPESLDRVDTVLDRLHWADETPVITFTVLSLGAYVGEVFMKRYGGGWTTDDDFDHPVVQVPLDDEGGTATINPIGKVFKQISEHDRDETYALYKALEAQTQKRQEPAVPTGEVHAYIPPEWPQVVVSSDEEEEEVRNVFASLSAAGVGNIKMHAKYQSDFSENTIPILIWHEDAPPTPVFVWLWPITNDSDMRAFYELLVSIRSHDELSRVRMAYYSRYPMPPDMDYLFSDSPGAFLFAESTRLLFQGIKVEDLPQHVPALLQNIYGIPADLSVGSLAILDAATRDLHFKDDPPLLHPPMMALAIYLGQVLNSHAGTEWIQEGFEHQRPMVHKDRQALDLMGIIAKSIEEGGPRGSYVDFPQRIDSMQPGEGQG
jgi:hypothetical protein